MRMCDIFLLLGGVKEVYSDDTVLFLNIEDALKMLFTPSAMSFDCRPPYCNSNHSPEICRLVARSKV